MISFQIMDFDKWARKNKIPKVVLDQLIEEDLNDLESLKECDQSILKMLQLTADQFGVLIKALKRLNQDNGDGIDEGKLEKVLMCIIDIIMV